MIQDKWYILSYAKIVGYGRPDFFIIKEENEVTQEQFDKMMDNRLERRGREGPWRYNRLAVGQKMIPLRNVGGFLIFGHNT